MRITTDFRNFITTVRCCFENQPTFHNLGHTIRFGDTSPFEKRGGVVGAALLHAPLVSCTVKSKFGIINQHPIIIIRPVSNPVSRSMDATLTPRTLCCPACKQLAPRPRQTDSILDVDATTFLPGAGMKSSSVRMEIYRRVSKIMYKLDLPMNFDRAKLIVVYSLIALRLGTPARAAVAYVMYLILAEHIEPSHPEHALSCYYSLWIDQIQDEDRRAAEAQPHA